MATAPNPFDRFDQPQQTQQVPAQYVVTGPDGQKYRITAPAAASQAEVMAYAQKQAAQQAQQAPALPAGFVMDSAPKDGAQAQAHGPWENYAPQSDQGAQDGPWKRYAAQTAQPNPYAQFVTKSENPFARFVQPQQGEQAPQSPSRDQVSRAFYAAKAVGNENDARQLIGYIQQHGMTLAPMTDAERNSAFQKQNAANVAAQPWYQTALQGAGKSFVDDARGVGQLLGLETPQDVANARQADQALMNSGWGKVGDYGGQAVQMAAMGGALGLGAKGLGLASRAVPYINSALATGAIAGAQPVAQGESRAMNTAVGTGLGVAGEALSPALGWVGGKLAPSYTAAKQAALDTAQRFGIPLHLTQVANGRFTKVLGSAAQYLPFAGSASADEAQRQAWNRALAATMGQDATELTPQIVAAAKQSAGDNYKRILGANSIDIDQAAMNGLSQVQQAAHAQLLPQHAALVDKQIDQVLNAAADNGGSVPGSMYQDLRNSIKGSSTANPQLRYHLDAVRHALEDAANRQIPDLAPLNARYNNIKTIEQGLKQVGGANNTITPANLYHLTQGKLGATQEMKALAQLGQTMLKDPIHNSGTAQRLLAYRMLDGPGAMAAMGAGAFLPHMAVPMASLAGTGATLGRFMNSPLAARIVPWMGSDLFNRAATLAQPAPYLLPLVATPQQ